MKSFAEALVRMAGRPVVDKTGLTGYYDITLRTALEPIMLGQGMIMPPGPPPTADPVPKAEFAGPSIFTAVQEQLGLKLIADDAPMEFVVIASAEKPSEN
jgi:uncharacterized protein (TIGR03435 family)